MNLMALIDYILSRRSIRKYEKKSESTSKNSRQMESCCPINLRLPSRTTKTKKKESNRKNV